MPISEPIQAIESLPGNKKWYVIGIIILLLISMVGGWFARDYKKQYQDEKNSRIVAEKSLEDLKVSSAEKEAELKKTYSKQTNRIAALDGSGQVIRDSDGKVVFNNFSEVNDAFESVNKEKTLLLEKVTNLELTKTSLEEKLKLTESSQSRYHNFDLLIGYKLPAAWMGGLMFKQNFGLIEVGLWGLTNIGTNIGGLAVGF